MRTFLRGKATLLFMTLGLLIAIPAVALADIITADPDPATVNVVEENVGKVPGSTGTVKVWLTEQGPSDGDPVGGCNANDANAVAITLSSNSSDVTFDSSGTKANPASLNACGLAAGKEIGYTVSPNATSLPKTVTVTADGSGGRITGGGTNQPDYNPDTFTITVKKATSITNVSGSGTSGNPGSANLSATLSSGTDNMSGKTVSFAVNPKAGVCDNLTADNTLPNCPTATAQTTQTANGYVATANSVSLPSTFTALNSPYTFTASYAGDATTYGASSGSGNLVVTPPDTTAPTSSASGTVPDGDDADTNRDPYTEGAWTNQDVEVTLSAQDNTGGSGVKEIRYTTSGTAPTATTGTVYSAPFTLSSTTTVKFLAVDKNGNVETFNSFQVNIDKVAPTPNCGSADGNWHAGDVTITCSPSDLGGSGLASSVPATISLVTSVPAGTQTANASTNSQAISDVAGNPATAGPISGNKVDKKAPNVQCDSADGLWHASDVNIGCTANDTGGSGLADSTNDASFNLSTNVAANTETNDASTGSRTVSDAVGNSATAGPVTGNMVDKRAPGFSCDPAPTAWSASNVNIDCSATDGGSGLNPTSDATFQLSTNVAAGFETSTASTGSKTLTDAVGNTVTAPAITGLKVDRKAPGISYVDRTAASANFNVAGSNGWYISPVQVEFSASDNGSGLAGGLTSPHSFNKDSGAQEGSAVPVASGAVSDAVGNTASSINSPVTFQVDLSNPSTPTFSGIQAQTYAVANLPAQSAISCSATDAISPPVSCSVTGYGSGFGSHTLTATATDQAGRQSTSTLTYIVGLKAGEVLSPINSTGKASHLSTNLDSFKIKSTFPVKFQLFNDAAKTQLMTSPPAGSVAKLKFFKQDSDTATTDLTESLTGLTPNTDNIFRWDGTNSQYIYNLGTSGKSAGTYGVQLTLYDSNGTVLAQSANYYFVLRS